MGNRSSLEFRSQFRRVGDFFLGRETLQAVVARRVLNQPAPGDSELCDHLIRERRRRSRMDGSIAGSFLLTQRAAWEVMEVGTPPDHASVVRLVGYLLDRQGAPDRWSDDGAAGNGFFSPGPRDTPVAPLRLKSGTVFDDEEDARFVASCLALRVVLRAGHERRTLVQQHIEGLLAIHAIDPHLAFVALGALGMSPPEYLDRVAPLSDDVLTRQLPDGTWPDVTIFHAVDMLLSVPTASARAAVRRAAPYIAGLQNESGAFDADDSEDVALIALRALDASRTAV